MAVLSLTWLIVGVGAEQNTQSRFVIDSVAGVVALTYLQAVC